MARRFFGDLPIRSSSNCLFVQATSPVCRYVVLSKDSDNPAYIASGAFEHAEGEDFVAEIRKRLAGDRISVSQAVLLLPRGDVEVNSFRLPPSTEEEIPNLVANMVAQQVDDAGGQFATDFVIGHHDVDGSMDVLSFTVDGPVMDSWEARFRAEGLKLVAVTFGGMGAVHLLGQVSTKPARTSIVVTTTDQDTDLAVVENAQPILFRTIPRATSGEPIGVDQLSGDIQRTLTLVGHPDDDETRVYLIGTVDEQQETARSLSEKLSLSVSLVNPFDQIGGESTAEQPSRFANLIGVARAWNQESLAVDLLHPRKPPVKPGPWGKVAFWGTIAASLLALGGYLLWEQAVDQRIALEDQKVKLQRLIKPAKKAQSKQVIVDAIQAWRSNDVVWLDELKFLSEKMPDATEATLGSLNMTMSGVRGQMDMTVEVSEPSVRMALEEAVRDDRHSIRSKRVTDASRKNNSAWRFQTVVTVARREPSTLPVVETAPVKPASPASDDPSAKPADSVVTDTAEMELEHE